MTGLMAKVAVFLQVGLLLSCRCLNLVLTMTLSKSILIIRSTSTPTINAALNHTIFTINVVVVVVIRIIVIINVGTRFSAEVIVLHGLLSLLL